MNIVVWAVVAYDDEVTIEALGYDPERLADRWAPAAQQEFDEWPELPPLIYMLVELAPA